MSISKDVSKLGDRSKMISAKLSSANFGLKLEGLVDVVVLVYFIEQSISLDVPILPSSRYLLIADTTGKQSALEQEEMPICLDAKVICMASIVTSLNKIDLERKQNQNKAKK